MRLVLLEWNCLFLWACFGYSRVFFKKFLLKRKEILQNTSSIVSREAQIVFVCIVKDVDGAVL